jgi:hypothetical protein
MKQGFSVEAVLAAERDQSAGRVEHGVGGTVRPSNAYATPPPELEDPVGAQHPVRRQHRVAIDPERLAELGSRR